jgi:hypothetical protein
VSSQVVEQQGQILASILNHRGDKGHEQLVFGERVYRGRIPSKLGGNRVAGCSLGLRGELLGLSGLKVLLTLS